MSQFLICKSKEDMSMYGKQIAKVSSNQAVYANVVDKYLNHEDKNDVWVILNIDKMINFLEENMEVIKKISQKAEVMIFWYGVDYDDLDEVKSRQELMQYLENNIDSSCLELYLLCEFS